MIKGVAEIPWDTEVFSIPCFELNNPDPALLEWASRHYGHYTVRVHPLSDRKTLSDYGFYYVDTLIEPRCNPERLRGELDPRARIRNDIDPEDVAFMCLDSFVYGRFHRDPYLPSEQADRRYVRWLNQLADEGELLGLFYSERLAGFIARKGSFFALHAMAPQFRGKGLARPLWLAACHYCFSQGVQEVKSSISAANLPALNLYASLGFHFSSAVDVYHRMTAKSDGS